MELELLLNQLSEYQTRELTKAQELTEKGIDTLNFKVFREGLFIFKKAGSPFFTSHEEDLLAKRFFDKLEVELEKEGIRRNKTQSQLNGKPAELGQDVISFRLDGLELFTIYPKSSRYAVYKRYQDEKEWLPSHYQQVKELTLDIELRKKEVELIEKLMASPMYGFSKEFKEEEQAWLESGKRGVKTGLLSKIKLACSLLLNDKTKDNASRNLENKLAVIEDLEETLKNLKADEERKRQHDHNLEEKVAKADAVLAQYNLFST